jgi:hypothetical protein
MPRTDGISHIALLLNYTPDKQINCYFLADIIAITVDRISNGLALANQFINAILELLK